MNRWLIVFLSFALTIFLAGVVYFFFPNWFSLSWIQQFVTTPQERSQELQQEVDEQILADTPEDQEKLFARAQQFFDHDALSFAERDLETLLQKNPSYKEGIVLLIKLHVRLRAFAAAEMTAQEGLNRFPNDPEIVLLFGDLLVQQKKFTQAKSIFASLTDTSPEKNYYLAVIAIAEGDMEAARNLLQNTASSPAYRERGDILAAAFKEFSLFPDGNPLHLQALLAKALNDVGLAEVSLELSRKVLEQNTGYRDAWLINGYSYLLLSRYEFAQNAFQKAFEIDPANPTTAYYLGITAKRLSNLNAAADYFERARKNGFVPLIELLKEIADTQYQQENYELALKTYEEILEDANATAEEFVRPMYLVLTILQKPETGVTLGNWAVEKHPEAALAWNLRGWAYLENDDENAAESDLEKALQIEPNLAAAKLNLGMLREKQEDTTQALALYEEAYNIDPLSAVGARAAERYNALLK